jgi:hypothetical protein
MKTGRQMISGKSYSFDSSGVWIEDTALKLNQDAIRDIGKTYNQLKKEHPEYSNEMASPRITDGYDAGLRDPKTKRLFIFDSGQDWSPFSEGQHSILLNYLDYAGDKLKCEGVACTAGELFDGWVSDTITFDAFFKQLGLKENEYEYFDPTIEEYDMAWGALCFIYEGYWIEIDTTRGIQYDHTNPRKNVATSFVMKSDMVVLTEPSISNSNYDIKEAYEKSDHWKTVHSEEEALAALLKTIPDYPYKSLISYVEFEREAFPGGGYYIFMYPSAYSPNWSMRMAYVHVNGEVETF